MDIESLRTFLAFVHTRHFYKAADELCISQSAVSACIRLPGSADIGNRCGDKALYRISKALVIERPVFAVYRSGFDRNDLIRKVLDPSQVRQA